MLPAIVWTYVIKTYGFLGFFFKSQEKSASSSFTYSFSNINDTFANAGLMQNGNSLYVYCVAGLLPALHIRIMEQSL